MVSQVTNSLESRQSKSDEHRIQGIVDAAAWLWYRTNLLKLFICLGIYVFDYQLVWDVNTEYGVTRGHQ